MVTFVIGGMTGVLMAVPPADFQLHNSLFLVAHFHNVIIGGVVFGVFAGYNYWFPKAFGFTARRALGQGVVLVLAGRLLSRLHAALCAGPDGHDAAHAALRQSWLAALAARRPRSAPPSSWSGSCCQVVQLVVVDPRPRSSCRDLTGDPWNGRTLEWSTASPPPAWNFAVLPQVERHRRLVGRKQACGHASASTSARARHRLCSRSRCRRTARPASSSPFFAVVTGFALIWHIWWMAALGLLGAFVDRCWPSRSGDEEEIEIRPPSIALVRSSSRDGGCAMNDSPLP